MRGADTSGHPDRKDAVLTLNEEDERWAKIKASLRDLKDTEMQVRWKKLILSTADPFADEIRYHTSCYSKYVALPAIQRQKAYLKSLNLELSDFKNISQ